MDCGGRGLEGSRRKAVQAAAEALLPTCAEFEAGRPETCGHSTKCRHPMSPIGRKYNPLFLPFQGEGGVGWVQGLMQTANLKAAPALFHRLTLLRTESPVNLAFRAKICTIVQSWSEFLNWQLFLHKSSMFYKNTMTFYKWTEQNLLVFTCCFHGCQYFQPSTIGLGGTTVIFLLPSWNVFSIDAASLHFVEYFGFSFARSRCCFITC